MKKLLLGMYELHLKGMRAMINCNNSLYHSICLLLHSPVTGFFLQQSLMFVNLELMQYTLCPSSHLQWRVVMLNMKQQH